MYGSLLLLDRDHEPEEARRVYLDEIEGKNERWLRDTLFANPGIIPIDDIDPTFGQLMPLCKEMRTEAGIIDAAFINPQGRLTIVECKRWKNPQARREVVAQTLDYVSALSQWGYADLQRQVSAALGKPGNVPFGIVQAHLGDGLHEQDFVDAVSRSLREGRVLVLIIGDGIREGLQSLADLVNRSATKAFSFGLIEAALYELPNGRFLMQPRVLSQTEILTRHITIIGGVGGVQEALDFDGEDFETGLEPRPARPTGELRQWWQPIIEMKFNDPLQEPPVWLRTNNVMLRTPMPAVHIKAWAERNFESIGVYVTSSKLASTSLRDFIRQNLEMLKERLPTGTQILPSEQWPIVLKNDAELNDEGRYKWLKANLNQFVDVLRPLMSAWQHDKIR